MKDKIWVIDITLELFLIKDLSEHFNVNDEIARNRYNNIYNRIY